MSYLQRQLLHPVRDAGLELALGLSTFVASCAKRIGSVFAAAPIIQGKWDGTGSSDLLSFPRGNLIGNQAGMWYDNFDPYQGSIVFWITPEWDGDDNKSHTVFVFYSDIYISIVKIAGDSRLHFEGASIDVSGWTAGSTYCVVCRWDTKNTLDGTNYNSISVNNVHSFGTTTPQSSAAPVTPLYLGAYNAGASSSDALIEGLTIYRRPLWDGAYGVDVGNGDEIALIHAADVGVDPCLITKGSWDIPLCVPTDSTPGALVTGEGEAWSHPHNKSEPKHSWLADGGYFTEPYAVVFNGVNTIGNCGSGATLDDLHAGNFTIGMWARPDAWGEGGFGYLIGKGATTDIGWYLYARSGHGLLSRINCATDAVSTSGEDEFTPDGKCHYFTLFYNQTGDRKIHLAVDGKWVASYPVQNASVGAIVSDAGDDMYIGNLNGSYTTDGLIGLVTIWNDDHFNHGTDFIPPRAPETLPDATVVEQWPFNEGTGNTAAAQKTTPANDCALTNHVWEEQWDVEGTPVIPQSVEFDEASTSINCGSDVDIDNMPAAQFTAEAWIRADTLGGGGNAMIFSKGDSRWFLMVHSAGIYATCFCATQQAQSLSSGITIADGRQHHIAATFDGTLLPAGNPVWRIWLDGIEVTYSFQATAIGAYSGDAASDLYIGNRSAGDRAFDGAIAQCRLSNSLRYTADFVPPAREPPLADDANALALWQFDDGAGTTLVNIGNQAGGGSGAANRNGTITAGVWNNTPDMEVDEPGAQMYGRQGYNLGSDGANDGMTQIDTGLTPGDDYVLRVPISVGQSGRAQAAIRIYDEIGAAIISTLAGPKYYGVHDGGNAAADLGDSTARWWQGFVGWTCYNIEDGSSCTITAVDGDMHGMTTPLAGGGSDDWQNGEHYLLRPPNGDAYCKHPWTETFCIELPAGCTSVSWKVLNPAGEGVLGIHQYEVQESLITNGSLEVGAGNPWIPTDWIDLGLDLGDTQASSTGGAMIHSGADCLQCNAGAVASEYVYRNVILEVGRFACIGCWMYANGKMTGGAATRLVHQASNALFQLDQSVAALWEHKVGIARRVTDAVILYLAGRSALCYYDDIYLFALNPVSLTVTPASEANSAESGGLRVDGRDKLTHPHQGKLKASNGSVTGKFIPRHAAADTVKFGQAASYLLDIYENVNNYVRAYWSAANTITLAYNAQGAGEQTTTWNATGVWAAGTERKVTLSWSGGGAYLRVDGATVAHIAGAVTFATDFTTTIKWGTRQDGAMQFDGVVK